MLLPEDNLTMNSNWNIRSSFAGLLNFLAGFRVLEVAVVAVLLSFAVVEGLHNIDLTERANFLERTKDVVVRVIRNEPRERTVAKNPQADPIVTGSTSEE